MQVPLQHADTDIWVEIGHVEKQSTKHPAGTDFVSRGGAAVWKSRNTKIKRKRERTSEKQWYVPLSKVAGHFPSETMHAEHQEACMQVKMTTCWFIGTQNDVPTGKEKTKEKNAEMITMCLNEFQLRDQN